jgi:hypothetical protein
MHTLARSQTSSASNPILDTYLVVAGVLTDVYSLEFFIDEYVTAATATRVTPAMGRTAINVVTDRVSVGRYAVPWVIGGSAPVGTYKVTFYFKLLVSSVEQSYSQVFEVVSSIAPTAYGSSLATVKSLRDEGVPASYSDSLLLLKLIEASREVEDYTGRMFGPTYKSFHVDGTGSPALLLEEPIIGIGDVTIMTSDSVQPGPVDTDSIRVYNRHITQNLRDPDDRENPRIEFYDSEFYDYYGVRQRGPLLVYRDWPVGRQNISVAGVFGYTEPDGTPTGGVPLRIQHAVKMLALMNLPPMTDVDARDDAAGAWRNVTARTREQSLSRFSGVDAASRAAVIGSITGNPEIDRILVQYRRGPRYGSA